MPLYAYRATDADGKEVKGSIDAPTEASAKEALISDLHLSVLELWEASRSHVDSPPPSLPPQLRTSFVFEGKDSSGIVRKGTIQAETKYEAFDKLRHEHHLVLSLLSPMGVKAPDRDLDLDQWQPKAEKSSPAPIVASGVKAEQVNGSEASIPSPATSSLPPAPVAQKKSVGFTILPDLQQATKSPSTPASTPQSISLNKYFPLLSTLRLYAGWLLAWYGLFVALGYYSTVRALPFEIPLVMSFYASPLIYSVTLGVFLFLLCTAIHTAIKGRVMSAIVLTVSWIIAFAGLRIAT
jgi:hypothetical protein